VTSYTLSLQPQLSILSYVCAYPVLWVSLSQYMAIKEYKNSEFGRMQSRELHY
jgi:hypothetical protein